VLDGREGGGFVIGELKNIFKAGHYKDALCHRGNVGKDEPAAMLVEKISQYQEIAET
jgi:hypothetical protein